MIPVTILVEVSPFKLAAVSYDADGLRAAAYSRVYLGDKSIALHAWRQIHTVGQLSSKIHAKARPTLEAIVNSNRNWEFETSYSAPALFKYAPPVRFLASQA